MGKLQSFFIGHIFEVFNMKTKGIPNTPCCLRIIIYCYSIWNLFFFYSRANSKFSFQLSLIISYTHPRCRINRSSSYYLVHLISGLTLFQLVVNIKRQFFGGRNLTSHLHSSGLWHYSPKPLIHVCCCLGCVMCLITLPMRFAAYQQSLWLPYSSWDVIKKYLI